MERKRRAGQIIGVESFIKSVIDPATNDTEWVKTFRRCSHPLSFSPLKPVLSYAILKTVKQTGGDLLETLEDSGKLRDALSIDAETHGSHIANALMDGTSEDEFGEICCEPFRDFNALVDNADDDFMAVTTEHFNLCVWADETLRRVCQRHGSERLPESFVFKMLGRNLDPEEDDVGVMIRHFDSLLRSDLPPYRAFYKIMDFVLSMILVREENNDCEITNRGVYDTDSLDTLRKLLALGGIIKERLSGIGVEEDDHSDIWDRNHPEYNSRFYQTWRATERLKKRADMDMSSNQRLASNVFFRDCLEQMGVTLK